MPPIPPPIKKITQKHPANVQIFDPAGWKQGKVTLFDALGLKGATYPPLQARLVGPASANAVPLSTFAPQATTSGNTAAGNTGGSATGALGGTAGGQGCSAQQTASNQKLGRSMAAAYGWGAGAEWTAFNNVAMSESGWCQFATNRQSGAYGIPQALPASKMGSAGGDWRTNPRTQIRWMLEYIKQRYKTPSKAWAFHQANNWY